MPNGRSTVDSSGAGLPLPLLHRSPGYPSATEGDPPPERVLWVGDGVFIRAFAGTLLQGLHDQGLFDGSVVVTPARAGSAAKQAALHAQDGLYTVWTRGRQDGATVDRVDLVDVVARLVDPFARWFDFLACAAQRSISVVISNTTELGIAYEPIPMPTAVAPRLYPARLTAYLRHRFDHFDGDPAAGMVILPCELIERNGGLLRDIVLRHAGDWGLSPRFTRWVQSANAFCDTLVDRIVPGFPSAGARDAWNRNGYEDRCLVTAEPYYLWVIKRQEQAMQALPFHRSTLNVRYVDDLVPYRIQKLRVLNGAHSLMAPLGLARGLTTVRDCMTHPVLGPLVRRAVEDVIVSYSELDADTLHAYAGTVFERFLNPYLDHRLRAITLNAVGKYRIRLLPVMRRYIDLHGSPPPDLCLSLATLLLLYHPGSPDTPADDPETIDKLRRAWTTSTHISELVRQVLSDPALWGTDLTALPELVPRMTEAMDHLRGGGWQGME